MSVTTALAAAGGLQIAGGALGMLSAQEESEALQQQGFVTLQDYTERARKTRQDATSFKEQQAVTYLKSGISLEGTPLAVLAETSARAEDEARALISRGLAGQKLAQQRADITARQGRAGFLAGIGSGIGSFARIKYGDDTEI